MWIFLLELFCLSLFTNSIAGTPKRNRRNRIGVWILQFILCFCVIGVCNIYFLSLPDVRDFSAIITGEVTLHTIESIFYLALWIAVQIVVCVLLGFALRAWNFRGIGKATRSLSRKWLAGIGSTIVLSWIFLIAVFSVKTSAETKLVINEVCSDNKTVIADDEENYSDYIELYNPTKFNIELSSFYISDDLDKQPRQVSTDMVITSGDFAIIWPGEGEYSFGISSSGGETIYLLNSSGGILDSVDIPQLEADTVYARNPLDQQWDVYFYPTPLQKNTTTKEQVEAPIFSAEAGFYESAFTLELNAAEDCDIFYTLDGSIPDKNAQLYTSGIEVINVCDQPNVYRAVQNVVLDWEDYTPTDENVDKAFIVRAVAIDANGNESDVVTKTYFVDMDEYRNKYALSLVSNPEDLFGEDGIYVTGKDYDDWYTGDQEEGDQPTANFYQHGRDYEVEASVELIYNKALMSQNAGLRIQGGSSRSLAIKGFKVYSRNVYSESYYFNYDIFDAPIHSFIIRSGNRQDGFPDYFIQSLVPDRGLGVMKAIPVSVFLDGEFWEDSYLREAYSEDFLAQKYNLDSSKITLISTMSDEIYDFLDEHDLSDEKDYCQFCELVDIQNYIDYMVANIYTCNMDLSETKNMEMWKTEGDSGIGYDDGRWRFLVYDMDAVAWNNESDYYGIDSYGINSFSSDHRFAGVAFDQETVFSALLENKDFCRQFVLTFMDFANTYYEESNVERQLKEWGYDLSWCNGFFEKRFDYIVPDLAEEFGLTGSLEEITLKINQIGAGDITINTVNPELSEGEWSGYYYTDYPVTITAEPAEGYEFVAWHHGDVTYTDEELEVELNEYDNLWEAEFVRIGE